MTTLRPPSPVTAATSGDAAPPPTTDADAEKTATSDASSAEKTVKATKTEVAETSSSDAEKKSGAEKGGGKKTERGAGVAASASCPAVITRNKALLKKESASEVNQVLLDGCFFNVPYRFYRPPSWRSFAYF